MHFYDKLAFTLFCEKSIIGQWARMHFYDKLAFTLFCEKSIIGQWARMHFYDKLVHAKNRVYQALIWIRPGYEAKKTKSNLLR